MGNVPITSKYTRRTNTESEQSTGLMSSVASLANTIRSSSPAGTGSTELSKTLGDVSCAPAETEKANHRNTMNSDVFMNFQLQAGVTALGQR